MSQVRRQGDMSMFSHVPLQPQWLLRLAAFQSDNPDVVRGAIHMLMTAFHAEKCGTIPNTLEGIAFASHLPTGIVTQYMTELTTGWSIDRRRKTLTFEPMAELANRLDAKFPEALQDMQERAVLAISSPDLVTHELLEQQGEPLAEHLGGRTVEMAMERMEDTKVRRTLPENATLSKRMKAQLTDKGFTPDMHEGLWEMFYSFHKSRNTASASWEGEFNVWLMNQIRYQKVVPAKGAIPAAFKGTEAATRPGLPSKVRQVRGFAPSSVNYKEEQGVQRESAAKENLAAAIEAMQRLKR